MAGVSLEQAGSILEAAQRKAEEIEVPMNVAVVDAGNNLTAFARMDGAWLGSIEIAQSKAFTARSFDMPTEDLTPMAQPGEPLFGIHSTNGGRVIVFPGGIPLMDGDEVVGAVGISGGTPDQDQEVCEAAVAAYSA